MILKKMVNALNPTGTKDDVPKVFHEPHVETGFRLLHQPWSYYLCSLFQRHNECMNAWTHLLAMLVVIGKVYNISQEYDVLGDPYMYPLMAGTLTMVQMYLCSFSAHCFHNKSEQLHYTCFFIDYAGIGIYGLGSGILHFVYCAHPDLLKSWLYSYYTPVGVVLSVIVTLFGAHAKTKYSRPYPFARKIWQVSSVCAVYLWQIIPVAHRLYIAHWDSSLEHHLSQILWFLAAGFFFSSDFPQRFFPGKFDFLGHSHQIFHICIMFMTLKQLDGIYSDIQTSSVEIYETFPEPTFLNTFGAVFISTIINIIVIAVFHQVAKRRIARESQQVHDKKD